MESRGKKGSLCWKKLPDNLKVIPLHVIFYFSPVATDIFSLSLMLLNCGVGGDSWEFLGLWEIQPVHSKGNQSWIFIGRTDVEAETPILWLSDTKSWLIWKDPDAGKDCEQEEKGMTDDEMVGWHHRLNGHEFE